MNHLLIAQTLADRADIPRNGLTDVASATGEQALVVQWVRDALLDIQTNEEIKWDFLHNEFSKPLKPAKNLNAAVAVDKTGGLSGLPSTAHGFVTGDVVTVIGTDNYDGSHVVHEDTGANEIVITATYAAETFSTGDQVFIKDYEYYVVNGVQSFDFSTFKYYKKSEGANWKTPLQYLPYDQFQEKAADYSDSSDPVYVTTTPKKSLRIWPAPDDDFILVADSFLKPQSMAVNGDIPILPENFHMMIVWKALIDYAGFEESSAIFKFAAIRYDAFYEQLVWQERYQRSDERIIRVE